jgi:hypothetical protein
MSTEEPLEDMKVTFAANVPISSPLLYPDLELVDMQGFAFTQVHGIVIQMVTKEEDWRLGLQD